MTRWLKAFLSAAIINLALSAALAPVAVAAPRAKAQPEMHQNTRAVQAGLERRVDVQRRVERVHPKRAVVAVSPRHQARRVAPFLSAMSPSAPLAAGPTPEHPPA